MRSRIKLNTEFARKETQGLKADFKFSDEATERFTQELILKLSLGLIAVL